jgi:hypothetical protein
VRAWGPGKTQYVEEVEMVEKTHVVFVSRVLGLRFGPLGAQAHIGRNRYLDCERMLGLGKAYVEEA